MPSTAIVPEPNAAAASDCTFKKPVPKVLRNSDQHREWQVFHAQPRCSFRRVFGTDHGKPRAAVLEPSGLRLHLMQFRPGPKRAPYRRVNPGVRFCSDHSGAGCESASSRAAVATTAPASFTSTAFTPDVPMSIPRYTSSSSLPARLAIFVAFPYCGPSCRSVLPATADCPASRCRSGSSPVHSGSARHGRARAARARRRGPHDPGFARSPQPSRLVARACASAR